MSKDEPLIWRDLTQRELDAAYDQAVYAPNQDQVIARMSVNSNIVRDNLGEPRRLHYGPGANEGIDVYLSKASNAPIQFFIHGGSWQFGDAASNAFPAELLVNAGAHFAVVDFDPVTDHAGDLSVLLAQLRRAVDCLVKQADSLGGDCSQIYLSGFSSGAHLAAMLLTTDWTDYGHPKNLIKGALLVSGMYDMNPVALSFRREFVSFTKDSIPALSPVMQINAITTPLIVAVGTRETPEFQRQADDFVSALKEKGKQVTQIIASEYNHFEIIETLANPYGILGRAVLQQMQLSEENKTA